MLGSFRPATFDEFGGLCTLLRRSDLPAGAASIAQDVAFRPGSVETRPGLSPEANTGVAAAVTSIDVVPFVDPATGDQQALLVGSADGTLTFTTAAWDSLPPASFGVGAGTAGSIASVATAGQRAYIAGNDGRGATGAALVWDPSIGMLYRFGLQPPKPPFAAIVVAGGVVTAGKHLFRATYVWTDGNESAPSGAWASTTTAGQYVDLSPPNGPTYNYFFSPIAKIRYWATPAGNTTDYYLVGEAAYTYTIAGNFAQFPAVSFNVTDTILLTAEKLDPARSRIVPILAPAAILEPYHDRLPVCGQRGFVPSSVALTEEQSCPIQSAWDDAFSVGGSPWNSSSLGAGLDWWSGIGISPKPIGANAVLLGDGTGGWPNTAQIRTYKYPLYYPTAGEDPLDNWLRGMVATDIGVRVLVQADPGATGTFRVALCAAPSEPSIDTAKHYCDFTIASLPTSHFEWREATFPRQSLVEPYLLGKAGLNVQIIVGAQGLAPYQGIKVAAVEVFRLDDRGPGATVWWSRASRMREFDALTSPVAVNPGDGQEVRAGFELGGRYFYVKDSSIWATQDDGASEPSYWPIEKVLEGVGTPSFRGVGHGDGWKVIAGPNGLHMFVGSAQVENLTSEIPDVWDAINWACGYKVIVTVDRKEKRIMVAAPIGAATTPNAILVLDYRQGFSPAHDNGGAGRKWAVWNLDASAMLCVELLDGTFKTLVARPSVNGSIYTLDPDARDDDGTAIHSLYETAPVGMPDGSLGLFHKIAVGAEGQGSLGISTVLADDSIQVQASATLYSPPAGNASVWMNQKDERVAVRVETNAAGSWFRLSKLVLWLKQYPFAKYRPFNP